MKSFAVLFVTCLSVVSVQCQTNSVPDECFQRQIRGPCRASYRRFVYDDVAQVCTRFVYSGCHGTKNLFKTSGECQKTCRTNILVDMHPRCREPLDIGGSESCSEPNWADENDEYREESANLRYSYDITTGTCNQFIYAGCGGNRNRFRSRIDCTLTCT